MNDGFARGAPGADKEDELLWSSHVVRARSSLMDGPPFVPTIICILSFRQGINHVPIPDKNHSAYSHFIASQGSFVGSTEEQYRLAYIRRPRCPRHEVSCDENHRYGNHNGSKVRRLCTWTIVDWLSSGEMTKRGSCLQGTTRPKTI